MENHQSKIPETHLITDQRDEDEMMSLILSTAQADERIRAVILNGSRANPNTQPDRFQDFDIVYVVTDLSSFVEDGQWVNRFGERIIMQTPTLMDAPDIDGVEHFTYLMQFTDGNRIDLTLIPVNQIERMAEDSLSVLLLDKDNTFEPFPPPSEYSYLPEKPDQKAFEDCCNEFWWVTPYVAKALVRGEILYAKHLLDVVLRKQLMSMLSWVFGIRTGFQCNPGKSGKHIRDVLTTLEWERLLDTYAKADTTLTWQALFQMGDLFRAYGLEVARDFGFAYPVEDDNRVNGFIRSIQETL